MLGIKTRIKKQIEEFIFNRSIYKIPSFFSDVKKVGVSTLIYKSGLKMTIYSLSSLFYSLGMTLPVFAVEDGTVKESDINQQINNTESKVNNILEQLNYNNLQDLQDMLYLSLKRLEDKENELLLYQKKCRAYEKVIVLLKKEIKVLNNKYKH